jgi:hypothetical protein
MPLQTALSYGIAYTLFYLYLRHKKRKKTIEMTRGISFRTEYVSYEQRKLPENLKKNHRLMVFKDTVNLFVMA